jgi:hypothetical protein
VISPTSMLGVALFPLWVTLVALSPLTVLAWVVLPVTNAVPLARAEASLTRALLR